jgi:hypothetical protein
MGEYCVVSLEPSNQDKTIPGLEWDGRSTFGVHLFVDRKYIGWFQSETEALNRAFPERMKHGR